MRKEVGMMDVLFHEWSNSHHQWMSSFAMLVSVMWCVRRFTVYMRSMSLRVKILPGRMTFSKEIELANERLQLHLCASASAAPFRHLLYHLLSFLRRD